MTKFGAGEGVIAHCYTTPGESLPGGTQRPFVDGNITEAVSAMYVPNPDTGVSEWDRLVAADRARRGVAEAAATFVATMHESAQSASA